MTRQPTDQDPSHIGGASGRRERGRTVAALGATLAKYDALSTAAVASPTYRQVGLAEQERGNVDSAGVWATVDAAVRQ